MTTNTKSLMAFCDPSLQTALIAHGFFTRQGGVSTGIYEGLNTGLGSDDEPALVAENRARIAAHFGVPRQNLLTVHQIHSPDVVVVDGPIAVQERPKADAMVTATPGLVLGILTADCGPLLFADAKAGIIGAAHAGWQGALGGVLENTVSAMEQLGADRANITISLGPCISQNNYEVGPEFYVRLLDSDPANAACFVWSQKADHFMFDLPAYLAKRATAANIALNWTGQCTYGDEGNFFSYRRTTHRSEPDYGRGLSAIMIKP